MNAPKLCPPPPVQRTVNVSSGSSEPNRRVISEPRIVPSARSVLETRSEISFFSPVFRLSANSRSRTFSSSEPDRRKS